VYDKMVSSPATGMVAFMIHKGVEYFLTVTSEPDVWQWRFQIGDHVRTGKTQTRLATLAERRVQLKIDAALKEQGASNGSSRPFRKFGAIQRGAEER
jgi:hypothetical protein